MIAILSRRPGLAALLLGAAAATGFAPFNLWPVALTALALWLMLVCAAPSVRAALWRGWLFGWAHLTLANMWIAQAFTYQDAMPHWLGAPAVALLCMYLAIYPMMAAGLAWRWGRRHGVAGAPETFVVDAKGTIRYKHIGPIDQQAWDKTLWPLIQHLRKQP